MKLGLRTPPPNKGRVGYVRRPYIYGMGYGIPPHARSGQYMARAREGKVCGGKHKAYNL